MELLFCTRRLTYSIYWAGRVQQDREEWVGAHLTTFSAIDPSYSLPNNIAVITLQVCLTNSLNVPLYPFLLLMKSINLPSFFLLFQELDGGKVLLRLAHLYEVLISSFHHVLKTCREVAALFMFL